MVYDIHNIHKQVLDFNKTIIANGFQMLTEATRQAGEFSDSFLKSVDCFSEENREMVRNFYENNKKLMKDIKKTVDDALEIDITDKDTVQKTIGIFEKAVDSAFDNAAVIQAQNAKHASQLKEALPKEGQMVFDFIQESIDNGIATVKTTVQNSFALANNILEGNRE